MSNTKYRTNYLLGRFIYLEMFFFNSFIANSNEIDQNTLKLKIFWGEKFGTGYFETNFEFIFGEIFNY